MYPKIHIKITNASFCPNATVATSETHRNVTLGNPTAGSRRGITAECVDVEEILTADTAPGGAGEDGESKPDCVGLTLKQCGTRCYRYAGVSDLHS